MTNNERYCQTRDDALADNQRMGTHCILKVGRDKHSLPEKSWQRPGGAQIWRIAAKLCATTDKPATGLPSKMSRPNDYLPAKNKPTRGGGYAMRRTMAQDRATTPTLSTYATMRGRCSE